MKIYKVVVDTNIFISAFLGSKNAKLIVRDIFMDQYLLIMSHEQMQELKTVLQRPKFSEHIHPHEIDELLDNLALKTIVPSNYGAIKDCRDAKDNMILEAAVYGNADFIITGDADLLVLNPYRWIKILTPTDYLKLIYELI